MYNYIIHLSDIHIRLKNREEEYRQVFTRLYQRITEVINKHPSKNGLIVITGDIFHDKVSLTPESIILCTEFFTNLAIRLKTIVIPGNHDGLLNSNERIDNISGVLFGKEIDNLHYFKNSGIHQFSNILFGISSIFDNEFIKASQLTNYTVENNLLTPNNLIKIGLYHGMVGNIKLQNMCQAKGEKTVEDFENYDYVLLGDIHTHQFLNPEKTIAYASSLISQNFSETDDEHGFIYWDLYNPENTHYEIILNDYHHRIGYLTQNILTINQQQYDINNKEDLQNLKNNHIIPHNGKVKLIIDTDNQNNTNTNTNNSGHSDYYKYLKEQFKSVSWTHTNNSLINQGNQKSKSKNQINEIKIDIKDIMKDILKDELKKDKINQSTIDYIYNDLNNRKNNKDKKGNNWKLLNLKISNLCLYNELNEINLSTLTQQEITLIHGQNNVGKSSIIDIISSILYNKIARKINIGNKRIQEILNINKKDGYGEILFQVEDKIYLVQRYYKRKKNKEIKSEAFLYKLTEQCSPTQEIATYECYTYYTPFTTKKYKMDLKTKNSTVSDDIEELLGNHDDFIFMNIMLQFDNISFRNMKQSSRKELLNRLLDLDIYEEIRNDIVPQYDKYNEEYKILKKRIDAVDIKGLKESQLLDEQLLSNLKYKIKNLEIQIEDYNKKIGELNVKYIQKQDTTKQNQTAKQDKSETIEQQHQIINDLEIEKKNIETLYPENSETITKTYKNKKEFYNKKIEELTNTIHKKILLKKNYYEINKIYQIINIPEELEKKKETLNIISNVEEELQPINVEYNKINDLYKEIYETKNNILNDINYELKGLNIDSRSISSTDSYSNIQEIVEIIELDITQQESNYNKIKENISRTEESIKFEDNNKLLENFIEYEIQKAKKTDIENKIKSKTNIIKELENHEYNPNCEKCKKHAKVKELYKLREEVELLNTNLKKINIPPAEEENKIDPSTDNETYGQFCNIDDPPKNLLYNIVNRKIQYDKNKKELSTMYRQLEQARLQIEKSITKLNLSKNKLKFIKLSNQKNEEYEKWNNHPIAKERNEIHEKKEKMEQIIKNKEKLTSEIKELEQVSELIQKNIQTEEHNNIINSEIKLIKVELDATKEEEKINTTQYEDYNEKNNRLIKINMEILERKNKIEKDIELINIIANNKVIEEELEILKKELKEVEQIKKKAELELYKKEQTIETNITTINNYERDREDYKITYENYELYSNYLKILHKNGLSLNILKEYLSHISNGINVIIEQFINKKVELYIEKDDIIMNIMVKDTNKDEYNVMMLGGREAFMMDIAFKIVLSNIANLPRSNFLFIDEGISVLDKENLSNINELFSYLNDYYEHVFLISHIEGIKDFINNIINIKNINGYSQIL
jgi:DNA repair exonuclease SbcCD ATPase subunit